MSYRQAVKILLSEEIEYTEYQIDRAWAKFYSVARRRKVRHTLLRWPPVTNLDEMRVAYKHTTKD